MKGKPAHFVSHNFYDKHTAVGRCCGVNTVNGICGNIHSALEAKGHVCAPNIVVDGFGEMNDIQSFFSQQVRCFLCAVSAQNNQAVQTQLVICLFHGLYLVQTFFVRHTH